MRLGVLFLVLAMSLTPAADGVAKAMAGAHDPMTIAFLRYLFAGLIALSVAAALRRRIEIPRGDRAGLVLRTALIMGAMTALIAALGLVPMAKAVGGFLIAPIASSLLGMLIWRERPDAPRLTGSALSVAGAAALMRPDLGGGTGVEAGGLLALLGGALLGGYLAATRGARVRTDPLSTLAAQCLLGAAMLAPFALADGAPAPSLDLVALALVLGAISATCHALTVAAYQRAEAMVLAPFLYFNMIAAVAVGYLWFGEIPTASALVGLGGIAAGGLVTLLRFRLPAIGRLTPARARFA